MGILKVRRFTLATLRSTVLFSALALVFIGGCKRDSTTKTATAPGVAQATAPEMAGMPAMPAAPAPAMASGTVVETMDAANYTYVRVKTASGDIWAATGQFKVAVGDKVSLSLEMPMEKFHSNSLNRTFPTIYFTSHIERQGGPAAK